MSATATERHWLWDFTNGEEAGTGTASRPWLVDGWTAATDGCMVLYLHGDVCAAPPAEGKALANLRRLVPALAPLPNPQLATLSRLREACGPDGGWLKCASCAGSGEDPFGEECPRCGARMRCADCGGRGRVPGDERPGTFSGTPFDLNRLARLLGRVGTGPDEAVAVGLLEPKPDDRHPLTGRRWQCLVVDGSGWRAALIQVLEADDATAIDLTSPPEAAR